jgi:hypothetical protein|tara:strand:- start:4060 stop:4437 length:378 start_codon:yes stop_codon:yes gene_type:complete
MANNFYSNLPSAEEDKLKQTIKTLEHDDESAFEFNVGDYDTAIAFFVKRGFERASAEQLAYIILRQAKIDDVNPQEVIQKLGNANPVELSEVTQMILNSTRYKSSRLGTRQTKKTKTSVSRNIVG